MRFGFKMNLLSEANYIAYYYYYYYRFAFKMNTLSEATTRSKRCRHSLKEEDISGASLNGRDPGCLKVQELKRWLQCRGASMRGKKADLVQRLVFIYAVLCLKTNKAVSYFIVTN